LEKGWDPGWHHLSIASLPHHLHGKIHCENRSFGVRLSQKSPGFAPFLHRFEPFLAWFSTVFPRCDITLLLHYILYIQCIYCDPDAVDLLYSVNIIMPKSDYIPVQDLIYSAALAALSHSEYQHSTKEIQKAWIMGWLISQLTTEYRTSYDLKHRIDRVLDR
jgi:hypothetical protein